MHGWQLVTGGSAGLGLALSTALAEAGWRVITDGRSAEKFKEADLPDGVTVVVGDLTDADHRAELLARVTAYGRLDLLVHNASTLGPLPMRPLAEVDVPDLAHVWRTNIGGPLVLTSTLLPWLREADGVLLSISSDAAVNHYEGWGLYGASKAGARPRDADLRRGDRPDGVRRRPRRHAHRDAPGRLPRRGHLRPTAAGDGRAAPAGAAGGPRPESGRYRAEDF